MGAVREKKEEPTIGILVSIMTYTSYAVLIVIGHIRDFLGQMTGMTRYRSSKVCCYVVLHTSSYGYFR